MNYHTDIKKSFEFDLAKRIAYNFVMAIFIAITFAVLSVYIFGLRMDVVVTGSMEPKICVDDIVVVKEMKDYQVGDVIEFKQGSANVTHRIIKIDNSGAQTIYIAKGDNTGESGGTQQVTKDQINGKVISIFTQGNKVYVFIKNNYFLLLNLILGMWVLASTASGEVEMRKHNIAKVS